ncbi:MAG: CHAP domain-containing protein [Chloroflexota bacterium]
MHGRAILSALVLGLAFCGVAPFRADAAFDVDGHLQTSVTRQAAWMQAREIHTHNVIRTAGFGDQCTAYALDRMHEATGLWLGVRGHAYQWTKEAYLSGWRVGDKPVPRSIVVMPPVSGYKYTIRETTGLRYDTPMHELGHVGWVESVDGDWIFIKDQNWQRGRIGERWVLVKDSPMRFIYSR